MKKLKFDGIDSWNRPIFKLQNENKYYGSVDILFNYEDSEEKVLSKIDVDDLEYFGKVFGCEPMGGDYLSPENYCIIKN